MAQDVSEKYMSPGVILPLETNSYVNLNLGATFLKKTTDIGVSATFFAPAGLVRTFIRYGTALSVVPTDTAIILSFTVVSSVGFLSGITGSGDDNGVYELYINDNLLMRFTSNIMVPNIDYRFPTYLALNTGDVVKISITNVGESTSDFTAACIGVF